MLGDKHVNVVINELGDMLLVPEVAHTANKQRKVFESDRCLCRPNLSSMTNSCGPWRQVEMIPTRSIEWRGNSLAQISLRQSSVADQSSKAQNWASQPASLHVCADVGSCILH
jgi:hypothetical protein